MASALAIEEAGPHRPWLVMVHGMSQDHRVFDKQVDAFRGSHRILAVDLPGHGLSSAIDGPFGHMEFAAHVTAALDARDVGTADYWGTHTGAAIGLLMATRQPERFRTLVLEGPLLPGENVPVVTEALDRAKSLAQSDDVESAKQAWWRDACWFDVMKADPVACRADAHRAIVFDFPGRPWSEPRQGEPVASIASQLSGLTMPVLLYNGEGDHGDFLDAARRIAAQLPDCEHILVPDAGGFPAWERPAAVNAIVERFFARARAIRSACH